MGKLSVFMKKMNIFKGRCMRKKKNQLYFKHWIDIKSLAKCIIKTGCATSYVQCNKWKLQGN